MIKTSERERIDQFWDWFNEHKYYYEEIENEWDPDLELLAEKIERIHPSIEAMIEIHEYRDCQIVITCGGIIDHFPLVRAIVNAAPVMIKWKAIAFIQPDTEQYTIGYKGYSIDSLQLFFMSYFDEDCFYICLYVKILSKIEEKDADHLARQILLRAMGEFHFATKVGAYLLMDFEEAMEEELLPLDQLYPFVLNNFQNSN